MGTTQAEACGYKNHRLNAPRYKGLGEGAGGSRMPGSTVYWPE